MLKFFKEVHLQKNDQGQSHARHREEGDKNNNTTMMDTILKQYYYDHRRLKFSPRASIFLLIDLREIFLRFFFGGGGRKKK